MSDGLTESRREERALRDWREGCELMQCALQEMHDAAFGVPPIVISDLQRLLEPYGLTVQSTPLPTTPEDT